MPLGDHKPRGLLRFGFRLPILLYRLHLGWLLGQRFLLLTHTGRKSGVQHQTIIEVVGHDATNGAYCVVAGFGRRSDWLLNIQKSPRVTVTVGTRTFEAQARIESEEEAVKVLLDYAANHPLAFRELSRILVGKTIEPLEDNARQFVQNMPVIRFLPVQSTSRS